MPVNRVAAGQYLCKEGGPGNACFIVAKGQIDILAKTNDDKETKLCTLGPGQVIGEVALLDGKKRSASARSSGESAVFVLQRDDFDRLLQAGNRASMKLLDNIVGSLAYRVRIVDNRYVEIFSKPGDTIAKLNKDVAELKATVEAGDLSDPDELLQLVGYNPNLPSSR